MNARKRYLALVATMDAADRQEEILDDLISFLKSIPDGEAQDEEPQTTRELEKTLAEHREECEAEERRCPYEAKLEEKIEENKQADKADVIGSSSPRVSRKQAELKALILKKRPDMNDEVLYKAISVFEKKLKTATDEGDEDAIQHAKLNLDRYRSMTVECAVDEILKYPDSKSRKAALNWVIKGAIRLPEDAPKVTEAIAIGDASFKRVRGFDEVIKNFSKTMEAARKNLDEAKASGDATKISRAEERIRRAQSRYDEAVEMTEKAKRENPKYDPLAYESPNQMIQALKEFKPREKPIDPDTVPELTDKKVLPMGVTTYEVQDDRAGQQAMRRILNTHKGEDFSPWCLLHGDGKGGLSDGTNGGYNAWEYWNHYNALPKRVAFKDGKLLAFMATDARDSVYDYMQDWTDSAPEDVVAEWEAYSEENDTDEDYEWLSEYHPEILAEVKRNQKAPEQWWDFDDHSHEGIPLGNMAVPNDPFGRWADMEIINGKLTHIGNYIKRNSHGGADVEWSDEGYISRLVKGDYDILFFDDGMPRAVRRGGNTVAFNRDGVPRAGGIGQNDVIFKDGIPLKIRAPYQMSENAHERELSVYNMFLADARRIYAENDQRKKGNAV